jgi:hypothetical protein
MIARKLWWLMLIPGAAQAATLPLKPGTYVLADTPCNDPPFAAMFDYDGRRFSYPHATDCRSAIVLHKGRTYRVRETCLALGDGSAAAPSTTISAYTIRSPERVEVRQGHEKANPVYRWCAPARANRGA